MTIADCRLSIVDLRIVDFWIDDLRIDDFWIVELRIVDLRIGDSGLPFAVAVPVPQSTTSVRTSIAVRNPAIGNPAIGNPSIVNPSIVNPSIVNPSIVNRHSPIEND
jgi:hypothetical protein